MLTQDARSVANTSSQREQDDGPLAAWLNRCVNPGSGLLVGIQPEMQPNTRRVELVLVHRQTASPSLIQRISATSVPMHTAHDIFSYRKFWAKRFGPAPFLPMSRAEMDELG